jgi:hypothetical protein
MVVEALFGFTLVCGSARGWSRSASACDEEVLRQGADPHAYASGILEVCKFYLESPLVCVSGVTGADLKRRITSIIVRPRLLPSDRRAQTDARRRGVGRGAHAAADRRRARAAGYSGVRSRFGQTASARHDRRAHELRPAAA